MTSCLREGVQKQCPVCAGESVSKATATCQQSHVDSCYYCDVGQSKNLNVVHLLQSTICPVETV